ncbi:PAS domain S-box protein, partial [Candidatus Gracilibacteria bacterium]|nr:PAS domain S-box protein [Candidatus Gracilibacteria bacterium]
MLQRLWTRLTVLQITDRLEARLARPLQLMLVALMSISIIGMYITVMAPLRGWSWWLVVCGNLVVLLGNALALVILRRGQLRRAAILAAFCFLFAIAASLTVTGLRDSQGVLIFLIVPVLLVGLLASPRWMLVLAALCVALVVAASVREYTLPLSDNMTEEQRDRLVFITISTVTLLMVALSLFLGRFSVALRDALLDAKYLNEQLQADLAERQRIEASMRESEARYRLIADNSADLISILDQESRFVYTSPSFFSVLGHPSEALLGRSAWDLVHHDDLPHVLAAWSQIDDHTHPTTMFRFRDVHGRWQWFEASGVAAIWQGAPVAIITGRDIGERLRLEAQLLQARKMEGIGRLAGGVAHDFNNLLVAIGGFTELARETIPPGNPAVQDLQQVKLATERATNLTRQLLAFARRQISDPQLIRLDELIADMRPIVQQLVREDIELRIVQSAALWGVQIDPRRPSRWGSTWWGTRAMPCRGGILTIETSNALLDHAYTRQHHATAAGPYVMLAISDTGVGMSEEVQQHLFEPFFTTKEPGHGTGLGLATCYGIVQQHGGTIWIYSELGRGTTVKIYLPRAKGTAERSVRATPDEQLPRGAETVLLVEDEGLVRDLAARVLRAQGYRVIEASNGEAALDVLEQHALDTIDLLLTDVIMPRRSGRALAEELTKRKPDLKVLYISGYTDNAISSQGWLDPGTNLLHKPFSAAALAQKVREVLEFLRSQKSEVRSQKSEV